MSGATQFEREIREQPEALERLLAQGRPVAEAIAAQVRAFAPQSVTIAARGSSDNAARYAQYLLGAHNRLSVGLAATSLFTVYDSPPKLAGALVIGISQSGQGPDIVAVLVEARRQGALTVALTNDPSSPLGQAAVACMPLCAGEERAVAATKTYTNQLLALAMISAALEGDATRWQELAALPERVRAALVKTQITPQVISRFRYEEYFVVLGRGFNYATAFEVALKIKETSYVMAEPYSSADFRHGPVAIVESGLPVLLIAPAGRVFPDLAALLEVLAKRQAAIVAISDQQEVLAQARAPLVLPTGTPEWLSPIVAVVPGQLWALALAQARGLDPDQPRGLSKVTQTR